MRSNQLSYRPQILPRESAGAGLSKLNSSAVGRTIGSQKKDANSRDCDVAAAATDLVALRDLALRSSLERR
jgi:hypothetical protein